MSEVRPLQVLIDMIYANDAGLLELDLSSGAEPPPTDLLAAGLAANTVLRGLSLAENDIGPVGVGKVLGALAVNTTLLLLDLNETGLGPTGGQLVAEALARHEGVLEDVTGLDIDGH